MAFQDPTPYDGPIVGGLLVTGGAGFIGSNFVRLALERTQGTVLVLDKLTYAGNLESLADVLDDPRLTFVKGAYSRRTKAQRNKAVKRGRGAASQQVA